MAQPFTLPPLAVRRRRAAPVISAQTIGFHYGKHHKTYVDDAEQADRRHRIRGTVARGDRQGDSREVEHDGDFQQRRATLEPHVLLEVLKPKGGGKPQGAMAARIDAAFGGYDKFKKAFANAAVTQFGSGWAWLVAESDSLKVVKTGNAEVPFTKGQTPLLTIDVWEHAYYLDYQNRRPDHVNAVIDKLLNWEFAADNLAKSEPSRERNPRWPADPCPRTPLPPGRPACCAGGDRNIIEAFLPPAHDPDCDGVQPVSQIPGQGQSCRRQAPTRDEAPA